MQYIASLIQTVLWVGLIVGIVWRFHSPIYGLLVALQKRIEGGSNIKAGPFELSDQLKPQAPNAQKEKVAEEVQEVLEAQNVAAAEGAVAVPQSPLSERTKDIQARYFQAEDLVLRSLQAEYGAPVTRQVTAGRDDGFDGVLLAGGRTTVVEVKYIASGSSYPRIKPSIQRLTDAIRSYGWKNPQIILALVYENGEDVKHAREMLSSAFAKNEVPVIVRAFTISQLREQFGVGNVNAG